MTEHTGEGSIADELEKLASLLDRGVLTPEEFERQKRRILAVPDGLGINASPPSNAALHTPGQPVWEDESFGLMAEPTDTYEMQRLTSAELFAIDAFLHRESVPHLWNQRILRIREADEWRIDAFLEMTIDVDVTDVDVTGSNDTRSSTRPAGAWLAIIGGILAAVAALLPWLSATSALGATITRDSFQLGANYGFSIDGVILIAAGGISVIIGIVRITESTMPHYIQRSPIVLGIIIGLVPLNRIFSIHSLTDRITHACSGACVASIGIGIYLCVAAGAITLFGGFILRSAAD